MNSMASTIVMGLMPTNGFGITLADMKFQRARRILILSKPITLNSVIIWLALLANHVVFLAVLTRLNARYAYSFLPSIAGNFTSSVFQITLRILWISLAYYFRHSRLNGQSILTSAKEVYFPVRNPQNEYNMWRVANDVNWVF